MKNIMFLLCLICSISNAQTFHQNKEWHFDEGNSFIITIKNDGIDGFFSVIDSLHNQEIIFGNGNGILMGGNYENNYTESSLITKHFFDVNMPILKELNYDPVGVPNGYVYFNPSLNKIRVKLSLGWFSLVTE